MTLLEIILKNRTNGVRVKELPPSDLEEAEVLVAWVKGDVGTPEACKALGRTRTSIYGKAGAALRKLSRMRYITITWNEQPEKGRATATEDDGDHT